MNKLTMVLAALVGLALAQVNDASAATLTANVSISSQTMTVMHRGRVIGKWPVSTARRGKVTPTGSWSAKWLSRHHKSSRYNNAPMPYSIFYNGNFAVHGTNQTGKLGRPASAGCVRLAPSHAAQLFSLAKAEGLSNTRIIVRQ
jgi:lipoprotein-anchoring transpeptidase ErfK/SrfK